MPYDPHAKAYLSKKEPTKSDKADVMRRLLLKDLHKRISLVIEFQLTGLNIPCASLTLSN